MPFDDDNRAGPTRGLCYICQRCHATHTEPTDDPPEVALRRAIETGALHTFHRCAHDGGLGLCRLVGEATAYATAAEARQAATGSAP